MENSSKITVFGATGKVGRELIRFLSEAGLQTVAITRSKSRATPLPFVEWLEADMSDKASLKPAMENSKAVFLASSVSDHFVEEQQNVIEVARELGVNHLVKLSSPGASKDSPFFIGKLHYEAEEILKKSGLQWTILQPNSFMQNWLGELAETVKQERKIYEATGDGKKPFIDTRDIAEVAFRILTNPGQHSGQTYLLSADKAVSYYEVADAISEAIGEKVEFVSLSLDEFRQRMEQKGMPQFLIKTFSAISEGQRNGKADAVTTVVRDVLNKPSRSIKDFANAYAGWFK